MTGGRDTSPGCIIINLESWTSSDAKIETGTAESPDESSLKALWLHVSMITILKVYGLDYKMIHSEILNAHMAVNKEYEFWSKMTVIQKVFRLNQ